LFVAIIHHVLSSITLQLWPSIYKTCGKNLYIKHNFLKFRAKSTATIYNDTVLMSPTKNNNTSPSPQSRGANNSSFISDFNASPPASPASSNQPSPTPPPAPNKSQNHKRDYNGLKSVLSTVLLLAIAPLIAFGITAFALQSYQVDGESMETTLQNNDRLIVDKIPRTVSRITKHQFVPHRGNIIIFNQANLPDTPFGESKQLIKRVICLPGERVVVKDGKITIYNKEHPEGFNPDTTVGYHITAPITSGDVDVTLQDNQLFVCGDNRPNSEDSRYFGPISTNDVVGKLVLRLLPINKAEKF
jgi:signal peptidase I